MQPTISHKSPASIWLPPLAVMALAWSLLPGLLPLFQFQAETWDLARSWQGLRFDFAAVSMSPAIGAFCVGFAFLFWLGLTGARAWVLSGLGIYSGLLLLYGLIALLSDFEGGVSAMRDGLTSQLLGLTLGAVVGALLSRRHGARRWAARLPSQITLLRLWPGFAAMPFVLAIVPLSGDASLSQPALGAFLDVPERLYQLIRALILWLPVGVIVAFAGYGHASRVWALAGLATLPCVANASLLDLPWREWMNLLAALPGLAGGIWLVERGGFAQRGAVVSVTRETMPARVASPRREPNRAPSSPTPLDVVGRDSDAIDWKRPGVVPMVFAALLLLAVSASLADFPFWPLVLGIGLLVYGVLLWFQPLAWLLVVPVALPLFDLAPWSGRFFLDEFDLLLAVTLAVLLLRGPPRSALRLSLSWPPLARVFAMVFFGLALIATVRGIVALPAPDANAFSNYWSAYNGLRVAKGLAWAVIFLFLARRTCLDLDRFTRWLGIGMGLGVLSVCLLGVWEVWLYSGLGEAAATYRSIGPFSGMHTAGTHLDAYLAAALPFLWLGMRRSLSLSLTLTAPLLALATYVLIYAASPGSAWVFGLSFVVLAAGSARMAWVLGQWRVQWAPMLLWASAAAALIVGGSHFADKAGTRQIDIQPSLAMADDDLGTVLFGMGLGSYPRVFLERGEVEDRPSTFGYVASRTGQALRLGTGAPLDFTQRIPIEPNMAYRLQVDARAEAASASLETSTCARWMLNSSRCVSTRLDVPGDAKWRRYESVIESGEVGAGTPLKRLPTEFALANVGAAGLLEIDNVRLFDANGRDLLRNGGFEAAGDRWFFKAPSALPWHIGNLWWHLVFELGWLGLLAFAALAALALGRVAKAAWRGQSLAWVLLASLIGLFGIGLFSSLLDAPRLAMLLMGFMLLAVAPPWAARIARKRRSRGGEKRGSRQVDEAAAKVASIH